MTESSRVAAIVLAAGSSRRMGAENKLLAPLGGKPMLAHVLAAVRSSRASPVIVVVGHEAEHVQVVAEPFSDRIVINPRHVDGLSTSMIVGLTAVPEDAEAALVCLGDMPGLRAEQIDRLIGAYDPTLGHEICVPVFGSQRGNPVLWGRRFFQEMMTVQGDKGARMILASHPEAVVGVEMDDDSVLLDIDTPERLESFRNASMPTDQDV